MLNVFIPAPIPGIRLVPFVANAPQDGKRLFQDLPAGAFDDLYTKVEVITDADLIILPHEYALLRRHQDYLTTCLKNARTAGKKVLISAYQDSPEPIDLEGTIILRSSAYRQTLLPNEIVMPAYIEDLGAHGSAPLSKGERPSVGFVGKANFATLVEILRYALRNYVLRHGPDREGIYFRRQALRMLRRDKRIDLACTIRKSFSGHRNSIELSPEEARRAYITSLSDSLFTLAPRGDGNYSLRFYETLSMGRIPLLIDTDMVLPLEDEIDYNAFIVRIPWQETHRIADRILTFYSDKTDAELRSMQERARAVFQSHLSMPAFLRRTLTREKLGL